MSLINDALKRAKEAQRQAPPPPAAPQLRPVEPEVRTRGNRVPLLAITVAALAILTVLLTWQLFRQKESTSQLEARAQNPVPAQTPHSIAAVSPSAEPAPVTPTIESRPLPAALPVRDAVPSTAAQVAHQADLHTATAQPPPPREETPPPVAAPVPVPANNPTPTAAVPLTEPPPSKPSPPKLQAIVFNPSRPSAIISGKTLFIGDKFGAWHVVAINHESATLVGAGQTNVLSLPQ